jgi:heat shock protein HtpX
MPFSFIDIEKEKNRIIALLFLFLILFYFVTAYLLLTVIENFHIFQLFYQEGGFKFFLPPFKHALITFLMALVVGSIHWSVSTNELIQKLTLAAGAMPIDPDDSYHQYLKNIVDEVSVAIGGRKIEPWVIRSSGMNAFALEDFNGRALIGVTEGLLARLNRAQIEAVVGHEVGHIASGDCLTTSVSCSLAEIYKESLARVNAVLRNSRGRGGLILILILMVLGLMGFLSTLLRCFISRERELRADAVGVRLTRDPLSLAEALKLITRNWRGEGADGENLQSIFIVNPQVDTLDDQEGVVSDLFSTHPPLKKRMSVLLSMAHVDEKTLEDNLKNFKRVSPVVKPEFTSGDTEVINKWQIFKDSKWEGPFSLEELKNMPGILPTQWVRMEGEEGVLQAYDYPALNALFTRSSGQGGDFVCPICKVALEPYHYEGALVFKCTYCNGFFVQDDKVTRILIREDYEPSEGIARLAEIVADSNKKINYQNVNPNTLWVIDCPKCRGKMHREFFVYSYPVQIDRCVSCLGVWFDKNELEILQYIYQHKDKFLYSTSSL